MKLIRSYSLWSFFPEKLLFLCLSPSKVPGKMLASFSNFLKKKVSADFIRFQLSSHYYFVRIVGHLLTIVAPALWTICFLKLIIIWYKYSYCDSKDHRHFDYRFRPYNKPNVFRESKMEECEPGKLRPSLSIQLLVTYLCLWVCLGSAAGQFYKKQ